MKKEYYVRLTFDGSEDWKQNKSNEEEIIEECNKLFVTMTNVHINGKAMKDLLDLYKAEKEKTEELRNQNAELIDELEAKNTELNKEKEKNNIILKGNVDIFQKLFAEEHSKYYISKDKIKAIIIPRPDNYIPLEIQVSDMYVNLIELLEEK